MGESIGEMTLRFMLGGGCKHERQLPTAASVLEDAANQALLERPTVQVQRIAHIIEVDGAEMLRLEQADEMGPRRECTPLGIYARAVRQLWNKMRRNQITKLPQHGKAAASQVSVIPLFQPCRMAEERPRAISLFDMKAAQKT